MIIVGYTLLILILLVLGLFVMAFNRERFQIKEFSAWGWGYTAALFLFYVVGSSWLRAVTG